MTHPLVEGLGLVELEETLERLSSREYPVKTVGTAAPARSDREHAEAMAREFNRPGGPRLSQRAIKP